MRRRICLHMRRRIHVLTLIQTHRLDADSDAYI